MENGDLRKNTNEKWRENAKRFFLDKGEESLEKVCCLII